MSRKIIFFDIDGTLLLTGGAGQASLEQALISEFSIDFPFEGVLTAGRTDRGITDEIFARYEIDNTPENRRRFRSSYLQQLPPKLQSAPGRLLPSVRELVHALAEVDDIALGVLTGNYEEAAWIKLRHYDLEPFFHPFGGFGDEHPHRDDVARSALSAAARFLGDDFQTATRLVIGDTPADITCARAIDATAVAVATGSYEAHQLQPHDPDLLFEDFSDTSAVVEKLLSL